MNPFEAYTSNKPLLFVVEGEWHCVGRWKSARGGSPADAYDAWLSSFYISPTFSVKGDFPSPPPSRNVKEGGDGVFAFLKRIFK